MSTGQVGNALSPTNGVAEPIEGDRGASILGPRNIPIEGANPDLLASPVTVAGTPPNLKFSLCASAQPSAQRRLGTRGDRSRPAGQDRARGREHAAEAGRYPRAALLVELCLGQVNHHGANASRRRAGHLRTRPRRAVSVVRALRRTRWVPDDLGRSADSCDPVPRSPSCCRATLALRRRGAIS